MARNHGWTVVMALLLGVLGASIFWLYGPYFKRQLAGQVAETMKGQPLNVEMSKGAPADLKGVAPQAWGSRYQMVADGKQVFLADLKEGRVWRYFHQTKESGFAREDEGFLPIALYYGGKKYYSASEVEPIPGKPVEATPPKAGEAKR